MLPNDVYQFDDEVDRLSTQNRLFKEYEDPIYHQLLAQYDQVRILDVGSNNGAKMVDRFSGANVVKVVGLEYHTALAQQAQSRYGNDIFSVYPCDVEHASFPERIAQIMQTQGVVAFDVIHISLVLLHLKNPQALLQTLRTLLSPRGQLLIVEAGDHLNQVTPDPQGLCQGFVDAALADPYSGKRRFVNTLPALLATCGYQNITLHPCKIEADQGETAKKQDIFDIFYSFIYEDALLMPPQTPWAQWVQTHAQALESLMIAPQSHVTVGFAVITCTPSAFFLSPMTQADIAETVALCDACAGENLYTKETLQGILQRPGHYFQLLRTQQGALAGYAYCTALTMTEMANYAKVDVSALKGTSCVAHPHVIHLQAAAVAAPYRKRHLSTFLVQCVLATYPDADVVFGLCWRPVTAPDEKAPIEHALSSCGFSYVTMAQDVWADIPDLVCPYCPGACHCPGALYACTIQHNKRSEPT